MTVARTTRRPHLPTGTLVSHAGPRSRRRAPRSSEFRPGVRLAPPRRTGDPGGVPKGTQMAEFRSSPQDPGRHRPPVPDQAQEFRSRSPARTPASIWWLAAPTDALASTGRPDAARRRTHMRGREFSAAFSPRGWQPEVFPLAARGSDRQRGGRAERNAHSPNSTLAMIAIPFTPRHRKTPHEALILRAESSWTGLRTA
jgi:hypothetical protein